MLCPGGAGMCVWFSGLRRKDGRMIHLDTLVR